MESHEKHLERFNPRKLRILYQTVFFLAVATALTVYLQSSFLKDLVGEQFVGLFFALASGLTLLAIFIFPKIVIKFGKNNVILVSLALTSLSLVGLSFGGTFVKLISFLLYNVMLSLVGVSLDIFIESFSKDAATGRIRGMAYTSGNIAWVLTPIAAGALASFFGFSFIFLLASLIFLPFIIIFRRTFTGEKDNFNHPPAALVIIKNIFSSSALRRVFSISFLLAFFYSWMVIYMPLHLRDLGFEWWEIGKIFSVMLLPFLLLEYPAGFIADRWLGEKELIVIGLLVMSISTIGVFFFEGTGILAWMGLLFATRVGAALVEIMRDAYFFKQIDLRDVHLISFFRNTGPLAYVISPILATMLLAFGISLPALFLILGCIVLLGLSPALTLKDTK